MASKSTARSRTGHRVRLGWAGLVLLLSSAGLNASCTSTTSNGSSGAGGAQPGICPLYSGSLSVSCPANETLVCGFLGEATGCCPTSHPYYCNSTGGCYETADVASYYCGSDCERCLAINATTVASSSASTTVSSSSGDAGSCNAGYLLSPPEPPGSMCNSMHACTEAPFSCLTSQALQDGLVCCCATDGTTCIGCMPNETCGGALGSSPVSCCSQ